MHGDIESVDSTAKTFTVKHNNETSTFKTDDATQPTIVATEAPIRSEIGIVSQKLCVPAATSESSGATATAFTPVSLQSMVGQLFHGIDSETLLAVPFFLLANLLALLRRQEDRDVDQEHPNPAGLRPTA